MTAIAQGNDKPEAQVFEADERIAAATRGILDAIGEDPGREGLARTPERVARMYAELTAGYWMDPDVLVNGAIFDVDYSEMVVVRDIAFFSLCEHHLLPFWGRAHVGYIPDGRVIGLSKIPRIVEMYARRLQVQERMTVEMADLIQRVIAPKGVAVVVEGAHMCSMMRGVRKAGARMRTSAKLGSFKHDPQVWAEFMAHLGQSEHAPVRRAIRQSASQAVSSR